MPFILVATGDQDIRLTLQQHLEKDGFTVIGTSEREACRELVQKEPLDAAIVDAAFMVSQETNFAPDLRCKHPDLPILAIINKEDEAEAVIAHGATDIIMLPIQPSVLRQRVRLVLSQAELAQLRQQDSGYRSIVEDTAEGIFRSTPDGRFIYVNAGLVRMLGYNNIEEVLALDIAQDVYFHPDIRDQILTKSESSDKMLSYELVLRTKAGNLVPVNVSSKTQRDAEGNVRYYEGIMIDMREKKRTESALYQFSEELQSKTQSLETINAIADLVYEALDVQTVVDRALDALLAYFRVTGGTLKLIDESGEFFYRLAARNLPEMTDQQTVMTPVKDSLSGDAIASRELLISEPIAYETRLSEAVRNELLREEVMRLAVLPLLSQGNAIGTITLPLHNDRVLTALEHETLTAAGKSIGLAIANAQYVQRIEAEVQERLRIEFSEHQQRILAEALRDTAAVLNSNLDQDRVLDQILVEMERVIPSNSSNVMLVEGYKARIVRSRGYDALGINEQVLFSTYYEIDETANFRWMVETGRALAIPDVSTFRGWVTDDITWWVGSHVSAPIKVDGEVIGFLNVDSAEPYAFNPEHANALEIFADQAGIAIRNARLFDATRRYANQLEDVVKERTAEVEHQRGQLQAILDGTGDGLTGVIFTEPLTLGNIGTATERYRYINQALYDMVGYTPEEWHPNLLRGENMTPEEHVAFLHKWWEELITKGKWKGEQIIRRKDGTEFPSSTVSTVVRSFDNSIIGAVTIFRDISQEKLLEAQKSRFISNAAHELRTPITNLKTRLYLARKQPERMDNHLRIMEQVTDQMKNLVEHLLDLSRIERGVVELRRERLDLEQFVADLVAIQQPEAEKKNLSLNIDKSYESLVISADAGRINQVITNLISNAVTYTPTGGSIRVKLMRGTGQDAGSAVIEVIDTGIGIPAEYLTNIFQPFYQATYNMSGVGLGLSISKEIVDLHGGSIRVESTVGEGTCFRVVLPLADTAQTLNA